MPAAVGAYVAWAVAAEVAISVATFAIIEFAVTALVTIGLNYVMGELFAPDLPNISNQQRDLKQVVRTAIGSRLVLYGDNLAGGQLVYASSRGTDNSELNLIIVHTTHPVSGFGEMYFNDSVITDRRWNPTPEDEAFLYFEVRIDTFKWDLDWDTELRVTIDGVDYQSTTVAGLAALIPQNKFTISTPDTQTMVLTGREIYPQADWVVRTVSGMNAIGQWAIQSHSVLYNCPRFRIRTFNGSDTQEACGLKDVDGRWTVNHRLRGCAYSWLTLNWDLDVWLTGIPQYKIRIFGKPLSPLGTSDISYSDNWAHVVEDYLRGAYGLNCSSADLDLTKMLLAGALSDEEVLNDGPGDHYLLAGGRVAGWTDNVFYYVSGDGLFGSLFFVEWDQSVTTVTDPLEIVSWDLQITYYNCVPTVSADAKYVSVAPESVGVPFYMELYTKSYWHGAAYPVVKIRLKQDVAGIFIGTLFFHIYGDPVGQYDYYVQVTSISGNIASEYVTVYYDMSQARLVSDNSLAPTAYNNFIDSLKVMLGNDSAVYSVDWWAVTRADRRYTCSGRVSLEIDPLTNLRKLLTAGGGNLVYSQGIYKLYGAEYRTATSYLTEDDLRGDMIVSTSRPKAQEFNVIRGMYVERETFYNATPFPSIKQTDNIALRGEELVSEIELPFTHDAYTATRLARIMLERNQYGISVKFPAKLTALEVEVMDTVTLSISKLGWVNKEFVVMDWTLSVDGGVDLLLQQTDATIYNDVLDYIDLSANTDLPSPWKIIPPTNLVADSSIGQVLITADGTIVSRILLTWDVTDGSVRTYEVQYKLLVAVDWVQAGYTRDSHIYIDNVVDKETYDIRVRSIGWIDNVSTWSEILTHTVVGKSALPEDVLGFTATVKVDGILLEWSAVSDIDLSHYEIRESPSFNLITEPNAEDGSIDDWYPVTLHTVTPVGFIPYTYAFQITAGAFVTINGDVTIPVTEGETIYIGAYLRSIDTTGTAVFGIRWFDSTGTHIGAAAVTQVGLTDWNYHEASYVAPVGTVGLRPYAYIPEAIGIMQFVGAYIGREPIGAGGTWETSAPVVNTTSEQYLYTYPTSDTHYFWIKAEDTTGNQSLNPAVVMSLISLPDNPVLSVVYAKTTVQITWQDCATTLPIDKYLITKDSVAYGETSATGVVYEVDWATATFGVTAVDSSGNTSSESLVVITPVLPEVTGITSSVVDNNVLLYWTVIPGSLPADTIELRRGDVFATATVIGLKAGTFTSIFEPLGGVFTYWLVPIDSAGNYGTEKGLSVRVNEPPDYVLNVIWNSDFRGSTENALASSQLVFGNCFETYDIINVAVTAGDTVTGDADAYAGAQSGLFASTDAVVGTVKSHCFLDIPQYMAVAHSGNTVRVRVRAKKPATSPSAQFALGYTNNVTAESGWYYFTPTDTWDWFEMSYTVPTGGEGAVDSVGIWGDPSGAGLGVLLDLLIVDMEGVASERLIIPVNTTIQYGDHFTSNSWLTAQDQIDAGFPIYIMPSCDFGTYEEVFDYGTNIASTIVTVDITKELISGTVTERYTISTSKDLTTWTDHVDTLVFLASDFRYLRFSLHCTSAGGNDILAISDLQIRLDSKLKNDSGTGLTSPAGAVPHNNLLQAPALPWIVGKVNIDGWAEWVPTADLIISSTDTPAAEAGLAGAPNELLWQVTPKDDGNVWEGGGRLLTYLPIDTNKMYIGAMFAKRIIPEGAVYMAVQPLVDGVNTSIRMSDGATGVSSWVNGAHLGWNLYVGILHPVGTAHTPGTETGAAGVYDLTGTKIADGEEYIMPVGTNRLDMFILHHTATTFGVPGCYFTRPMLRETTLASAAADVQEILAAALSIGTTVEFGSEFVDISSIVVTPNSTDNITAVYNFIDVPDPKSFTVYLYDSAGNKVAAEFGWIARGY